MRGRGWRTLALAIAVLAGASAVLVGAQIRRSSAVRAYDASTLPVCRVDVGSKLVALSFDDGPTDRFTPSILRTLRDAGAYATFFVVGDRLSEGSATIGAEVAASMEIGDHTWSHPHLEGLSLDAQQEQIARTQAELGDVAPSAEVGLFRAPFGEIGADGLRLVRRDGLRAIGWSIAVDPYLSAGDPPGKVADAIAQDIRPGDIILAHDGGADRTSTVAMLPRLLASLDADGYRVVSVGELLDAGRPARAEPRRWFWQAGFSCPRPRR